MNRGHAYRWLRLSTHLVKEVQELLVISSTDRGELNPHTVLGHIAHGTAHVDLRSRAGELEYESGPWRLHVFGAEKHASHSDDGRNPRKARPDGVNFNARRNRDAFVTPQRSMGHMARSPD